MRDGQTIVLGGLTDRERDQTNGGVPLLSDLPVLGGLFGRVSRQNTSTELFLFLTPRVLRTDDEVDAATRDCQGRAPERSPEPNHPQEPRP